MDYAILIKEWDSDSFHRRVLDLEAKGYAPRSGSYRITPEMDPESGEIVHLYSIEMDIVETDNTAA
jgi:hypothetical protein